MSEKDWYIYEVETGLIDGWYRHTYSQKEMQIIRQDWDKKRPNLTHEIRRIDKADEYYLHDLISLMRQHDIDAGLTSNVEQSSNVIDAQEWFAREVAKDNASFAQEQMYAELDSSLERMDDARKLDTVAALLYEQEATLKKFSESMHEHDLKAAVLSVAAELFRLRYDLAPQKQQAMGGLRPPNYFFMDRSSLVHRGALTETGAVIFR